MDASRSFPRPLLILTAPARIVSVCGTSVRLKKRHSIAHKSAWECPPEIA